MSGLRIVFFILFVSLALGALVTYRSNQPPACANSLSCEESLSLKVENGTVGIWSGREVTPPTIDLAAKEPVINVLGDTSGAKRIEVDLATQTLTAYQGDDVFLKTLVSTGKWGRTPTGEFSIWTRFRATRMSGGQGNDYYNLPNVPFVMYFYNNQIAKGRGYSLHGTYWHNNFGHPMSHGCVNMRTVDAEKIYYWADGDTKINIYGQAPL
jgi:lipoprotein-anchoring transpeptidase ErfK/SrfK